MNSWLKYAVKKARSRKGEAQKYRLNAVLIRGGSVLAEGTNQPADTSSFRVVNPKAPEWMGIHAEIDCLRRATPEQIEGSTLFVGGVKPSGGLIVTKPCQYCEEILRDSELSAVVWHTAWGTTRWSKN